MAKKANEYAEFVKEYPADLIVFIGAGASVRFGMPLMNDFFRQFVPNFSRETVLNVKVEKNMSPEDILLMCIREVYLKEIESTSNTFSPDLEHVLSYTEKLLKILKKPPIDIEYSQALKFAILDKYGPGLSEDLNRTDYFSQYLWGDFTQKLQEIYQKLTIGLYGVYGTVLNDEKKKEVISVYDRFFEKICSRYKGNIMIFTTNYDPCLDIYFTEGYDVEKYEKFFKNGFRRIDNNFRKWHARHYFGSSKSSIIGYFNLHGSVLWKNNNGIACWNKPSEGIPEIQDISEAQLVLPLVNKGTGLLTTKMYRYYETVLSQQAECDFICIGYSWRDKDLVSMTRNFLDKLTVRRYIYVDLYPDTGFENLYEKGILGIEPKRKNKYKFIKQKFGDDEMYNEFGP